MSLLGSLLRGGSRRLLVAAIFAVLALYSTYQPSTLLLRWLYRVTLVPLNPLLLSLPVALIAAASLTGRLEAAAAPLILWSIAASLTGRTMYSALLSSIALLPLSRIYYYGGFGSRLSRLRRAPRIPLYYLLLAALIGGLSSLAVYGVISEYDTVTRALLQHASGDLRRAYMILRGTLLLSMLIIMLGLYVIYRGIEALTGTGLFAIQKPPSLFRVEAMRELGEWRSRLLFRVRKQEGILRGAQVWIFSLLLSPFLFPVLRLVIYSIPGLPSKVSIAAYMIASYAVSWIVLQALYSSLFDPLTVKELVKPRRASTPIILGFLASGVLTILYAAVGGDPLQLLKAVLTGKPAGPDPLAEMVNLRGVEDGVETFMRLIYRVAELGSRFLWGPA